VKRLTRPAIGASADDMRAFSREFFALLDEAGIQKGDEFTVEPSRISNPSRYQLKRHDEDQVGPSAAGSGQGTSIDAALSHFPRSGSQRHRVLLAAVAAGERGVTSDELVNELDLLLQSIKPRIVELRKSGYLRMNGQRRRSKAGAHADVHVATGKAYLELARQRVEEPRGLTPLGLLDSSPAPDTRRRPLPAGSRSAFTDKEWA
jgi:hypothetical protein